MSTDLASAEITPLVLQREVESAKQYIDNALSPNTILAYRSQWAQFSAWCEIRKLESCPAPPETVATYISWMADNGKKVATITRMLSSISKAHKTRGLETPMRSEIVRSAYFGIRRTLGVEQNRVNPITIEQLKRMCDSFDESVAGIRNRALLLVGFMGGFRRSELVTLQKRDVKFHEEGVKIKLRRSKTDQEGAGVVKAIAKSKEPSYCPVEALTDWFIMAPESKHLFCHVPGARGVGSKPGMRMSDRMIARLLQRWSTELGIDGWFAGHSLRAGFVTAAAKAGKSDRAIMRITGHKSHAMVSRYVREANEFADNAGEGLL